MQKPTEKSLQVYTCIGNTQLDCTYTSWVHACKCMYKCKKVRKCREMECIRDRDGEEEEGGVRGREGREGGKGGEGGEGGEGGREGGRGGREGGRVEQLCHLGHT